MGFVAILSLLEHSPSGIPSRYTPGDHLPGWGAQGITCRRTAEGIRFSAGGFTVDVYTDGTVWSRINAFIEAPTNAEVEAFNKIMRGTGFPRVETNWRTKALSLNVPGRRVPLPVRAETFLDSQGKVTGTLDIYSSAAGRIAPSPIAAAGVAAAKASLTSTPPVAPVVPVGVARAALTPNAAPVSAPVRAPISPVKPEVVVTPLKAERLAPLTDPTGVFTWPTKSSGIVIPAQDEADLDRIWDMHMAGDRQVVALRGPSGTGKTSLAYDLAARKGVGIAKIDGAGAVTFADWVGFQSATERNGATVTEWLPSGFIQAVRSDGPMAGIPRIVLLDEVNRAESSGATNALIPCLDHTGSLYIADAGRAISLDPTVMYVMTANMGGAYTGTIALDVALTNRVTHWVTMGYPSESVEVGIVTDRTGLDSGIALQLVRCAQAVREIAERGELAEGVGPRLVLMAARKIKAGFTPRSACMSTWAMAYSDEGGSTSEQGIVRSRIESAFRA